MMDKETPIPIKRNSSVMLWTITHVFVIFLKIKKQQENKNENMELKNKYKSIKTNNKPLIKMDHNRA